MFKNKQLEERVEGLERVTRLQSSWGEKIDNKYRTLFIKLFDHLNLELDVDDEGEPYVKAGSKTNNKTKAKATKVGKRNSSIRDKGSEGR